MATHVSRSPRADAERNRTKILEQAARLMAADPDASMVQIAQAAGVGRATLYRHFASREDVVTALRNRAFARARDIIARELHRADSGLSPAARLERLIGKLLTLGEPYRFIADQDPHHHREAGIAFDAVMLPLISDAQASRELTQEVPARGIALAMQGLMLAANRGMQDGELTPEQGTELVRRGLLQGFAAP